MTSRKRPLVLAVGDEIRCPHCDAWHALALTTPANPHPYVSKMLYFACGRYRYFAGCIGDVPRRPHRRPAT